LTLKVKEAANYFNLDATKKTLLVLGGSLGARRVNQLIEKELENIQNQNVQVICGSYMRV
jgi:UDP-N-acetylglucosamine--N-acetylmuramyl-(pentapeptide) pyrophosphoryl-undecaprenol N-acetylglucosamine transferase